MQIEILADEAFTATDVLISQSFVVAFVHPTYMQIVLIWGFPAQLSLWKSVHWLWRYKLNEVCDSEGESLVDITNHPNWLTFSRSSEIESDYPRVVIYINIRLLPLCFSLRKDIINHKDILLILFFNNNNIFWLINVYSDSFHTALKYLKDTEVCIQNLLIMTGDFNICDSL